MRRFVLCALLALCCTQQLLLAFGALTPTEQQFMDATTAAGARASLQFYTSAEHMAGTPGDYATALYTQQQMASFGLSSEIVPFRSLVNWPLSRSLVMTLPSGETYTPSLSENIYPDDPTSDSRLRNLTFHGYGASGDVSGPLIYVNYGAASDFELLKSQGIDFTGSIVIVRYGKVFRGLKVQNAQAYGAVGCLIYSDPIDDGFTKGAVYDQGPWRPESGVQRGSVQFLSRCSGDPGFLERDPDVCGYPTDELIPSIPSLPLSWGDAQPLLAAMSGPAPPDATWIGGLNVTYTPGPSQATVHLTVSNNQTAATLWNVITTIPGSHADPEVAKQQVILGNHRDAWVYGSTDPNSGTAVLLEIGRGLGNLLASGWRSDRTIILASWDGEEYGLLGSVNYAESNAETIQKYTIAYLNVDVAVTGSYLSVSSSPSLANVALDASMDVTDPNTNTTLFAQWASAPGGATVGILGSGSDFAPFLHHLGVSSLDMAFTGPYGVYHSVYDSFFWMEHFGDPQFVYHRAMAQLWGLMAMRVATARVLPLQAAAVSTALPSYLATVQLAAWAARLPAVDWTPLSDAIDAFAPGAAIFECYRIYAASSTAFPDAELATLNANLIQMERAYLVSVADGFEEGGLPGRRWFKHVLQAPGLDTGYDANVFPSLSDAIAQQNATETALQVTLVSKKLDMVAAAIKAMTPYVAPGCTSRQVAEQ